MKLQIYSALATALTLCAPAFAQLPKSARLFEQNCLMCHGNVKNGQTPDANALRRMTPEAIVAEIGKGAAHEPLARLSDADRRAIAEYLAGRNFMAPNQADAQRMPNACSASPAITSLTATPAWNGWGADATNGRFQTAAAAGLPATGVSRLKLKWAFGFPVPTTCTASPPWPPAGFSWA